MWLESLVRMVLPLVAFVLLALGTLWEVLHLPWPLWPSSVKSTWQQDDQVLEFERDHSSLEMRRLEWMAGMTGKQPPRRAA
jgi:hypothetical protein